MYIFSLNNIKLALGLFVWALGGGLMAQSDTSSNKSSIPIEITDAFRAGNSRMLSPWLSGRTLIAMDGKSARYTRQRAQAVLKKFFKENPPTDFEFLHQSVSQRNSGKSKETLFYYIASYLAEKKYRMHMLVRYNRSGYQISRISFDEQ